MNLNGTTNHHPEDDDEPFDGDDSNGDGFASLPAKQQRAIAALINEPTLAKAAESAEVSIRTLHRWLDEERFSRPYRKARREVFGQAIGLCQRYSALAVQTLAQVMNDRAVSSSARVSASVATLKFGRESIELDDLAGRVEALERAAENQQSSSWRPNH